MRLEILSNVFLKKNHLLMELSAPKSLGAVSPGQFLHVRVSDSCDPLLRRPLSIHDVVLNRKKDKLTLRVLYEVVGKGTLLLSQKKPLSEVEALGPLGNGFDLDSLSRRKTIIIVAGGMGVAPLFFLAKKMMELPKQKTKTQKIIVLIGARDKEYILRDREFKGLGCEVLLATEDGSRGFKGRVTEVLEDILATTGLKPEAVICACGPKPMLAAVAGIARKYQIAAQVSLEEFMGCGLGACLGCVIRTTSGYKRICHDGPVFDASSIIWRE